MAFKFSPRIVTDGLILYSDVSNSRSFVSGNTTFNDMSLTQINGSLSATSYTTNNINNIGSITLSGTGAITYQNNNNIYELNIGSIAGFFKVPNQVDTVWHKPLICKQNRYALFALNNLLVTYDWGNAVTRSTTFTITDSQWHYVTMTWTDMTGNPSNNANIYVDGNLILTTTIKFLSGSTALYLGFGNANAQFFTGDINVAQVYNRVLTQQEIIQNYNTLKSRFSK